MAIVADPARALERITAARVPFLIGVRHHSPACARAIPGLLSDFAPEVVLVELPPELQPWLEWLGHEATEPPVALAAASPEGALSFYPFAEFSPERVAIRWALERGLPVVACDLSLRAASPEDETRALAEPPAPGLLARLLARHEVDGFEELWDRCVEAPAPDADPERVRRAGLLLGWALRLDQAERGGIEARDLQREAAMRAALGRHAGRRVAAVVGAFHASALLDPPLLSPAREPAELSDSPPGELVTSLVPYSNDLLDSRSGYPAGIRDPLWQEAVFRAEDGAALEAALAEKVVAICAHVRAGGHVAGVPDAREALRLALDLARLRALPAPGRRELWEALEVALGRGERLGRGQVLARAGQAVLVGTRRGRLAPGTPRSGLGPHVEALLAELNLPGPREVEVKDLRLDPLRSGLDRRRQITLSRLEACRVRYAEPVEVEGLAGSEALTTRWRARWEPQTSASLELAGLRGVTLEQAAQGALLWLEQREEATAAARLSAARLAARCGLSDLARLRLAALLGPFLREATLPQLLEAMVLVSRVLRGHEAGLLPPGAPGEGGPGAPRPFTPPATVSTEPLLSAAIAAVEGISGSSQAEDVRALGALVQTLEREQIESSRLRHTLRVLEREGSPLIRGGAAGARLLLGEVSPEDAGEALASWTDLEHAELRGRLAGALLLLSPLLEADPGLSAPLRRRVLAWEDGAFLERLPALRGGFEGLSPAARERLLAAVVEEHGLDPSFARALSQSELGPEELEALARAERAGRLELEALGLWSSAEVPPPATESASSASSEDEASSADVSLLDDAPRAGTTALRRERAIGPEDRWRLILARKQPSCGLGRRAARALDELYGGGREGFGDGGGNEGGFPSARVWARELEDLFGAEVCEEVLGRAVEAGWSAAAFELDPEQVSPSVELLQGLLSLRGGLGEGRLGTLRRLVDRVVERLVEALALRLQPALSGLATQRPTRRPTGALDLGRTVRRNLHRVYRDEDGASRIAPERWVFRERARPSLDWRLVLVVDVSGSMEPSTIYAALMAAILSRIPALDVRFLAFNTEVVDLSEHTADPLALLLEVSVGGGTAIARALRAARELLSVPSRSLVVCVSDFEEGGSVGRLLAEVQALVETGATALGLAALDDRGQPRYARAVAEHVVAAGMPIAALTPLELARWVGDQVRAR